MGMVGSLLGGVITVVFGQGTMDTASAFLGTFASVGSAGVIAPSRRREVMVVAASLAALLAVVVVALSFLTQIQEFAMLSTGERVLQPIAQLLGALYAFMIIAPMLATGTILEDWWRGIITLGVLVGTFGVATAFVGLVVGLLGHGWLGVWVGGSVLLLGALTYLFPYAHLFLRMRNFQRAADNQLISAGVMTPEIGRHIEWTYIVGHVFRVLDFDRAGTTVGPGNRVNPASRFEPYGYLLVESPILNQSVRLPIVHRDDFSLAASVFDEPRLLETIQEEELLVTYVPKHKLPKGLCGASHALHYVVTPRGTLDRYYEIGGDMHMARPEPEKLFGKLVWDGEIRVQVNSNPDL